MDIRKIKNLIFDFGGVLVELDKARCLEAFNRLGFAEAEKLMEEAEQVRAQAEDALQQADGQKQPVQEENWNSEEMQREKEALQDEIEMLRAAARDYRQRFLRLVEDQQHVLNAETELFD